MQVANLERVFIITKHDLQKVSKELAELEAQIAQLNEQYSSATMEMKTLQDEQNLMEKRLVAAHKLMSGLGSEFVR